MRMKLPLWLVCHFSCVLCAVEFICYSFADASNDATPTGFNITVNQSTSILIYNQYEAAELTSVPIDITQKVIHKKENGFTVCTSKMFNDGDCSTLGEFIIRTNKGKMPDSFLSKVTGDGDEVVFYRVKTPGFYCAAAYQDNGRSKVEGVEIVASNGIFSLPVERFVPTDIGMMFCYCTMFILLITVGFPSTRIVEDIIIRTPIPHKVLVSLLFADINFGNLGFMLFLLSMRDLIGWIGYEVFMIIEASINLIRFLFICRSIFSFSLNMCYSGYDPYSTHSKKRNGEYYKEFIFLLSIYSLNVIVLDILNITYIPTLISLKISGSSIVIIPALCFILNKNFELAMSDIIDPYYLQNFRKSRTALFFISVPCFFASNFHQFIKPYYHGDISVGPKGRALIDLEKILGSSLTVKLTSRALYIGCSLGLNLVVPVSCCTMMYIWRSKVGIFPSRIYSEYGTGYVDGGRNLNRDLDLFTPGNPSN